MAKRDLYHNITEAQISIPIAAHTAAVAIGSAATIDTYGYHGVVLEVLCGTITDGTHSFTLYESDTDVTGNYTSVAAGDMLGAFANVTTSTASNQRVGYIGSKRYLRVVSAVSGATTGGVYGVAAILGYPMHAPAPTTAG